MTNPNNFYFPTLTERIYSYEYIENFIHKNRDGNNPINTLSFLQRFESEISEMDKSTFFFLLLHCGAIPELYIADSSEESIYSKLCEAMVKEWAIRIGFAESYLPTAKSSTEDVAIINQNNLIVCDAKSFRLGRSQAAPNVKDMLKEGDINKWLNNHKHENKLGGLVVFPSTHDWKSSSDFYLYTTNKNQPILSLYYDHLAYMLFLDYSSDKFIKIYKNYGEIFPNQLPKNNNNVAKYYKQLEDYLFPTTQEKEHFASFQNFKSKVISENVFHTHKKLENERKNAIQQIHHEIDSIDDIQKLRALAKQAEILNKTAHIDRQIRNVKKFRGLSDEYYEPK